MSLNHYMEKKLVVGRIREEGFGNQGLRFIHKAAQPVHFGKYGIIKIPYFSMESPIESAPAMADFSSSVISEIEV